MNAEIRLENNFLSFRCPDAGVDERRPVSPDDVKKSDLWIEQYRDALEDKRRLEKILIIGKDIFDWLDGTSGVMQKLLDHASDGLVLEFAVKSRTDNNDLRFLEIPWELLAADGQHLAADEFLSFCPIRRIGNAEKPLSPSEFRLSTIFMAAAPRNAGVPLRYEEEEAAMTDAAGNIGMDLMVEESGSLPLLAELLAREPADVLHISCHGNNEPEPFLALEDEEGALLRANARNLNDALGIHKPKLLFLSACLTSEPNKLINSMSTAMIRYGVPAVLGWSGSVKDVEAIRFAHALYESLSRANSLERAISDARYKLLKPDDKNPKPSEDWHLARLYLGKSGGGILSGTKARSLSGSDRGHKEFLDAKTSRIPVASRREFVGRRREIQAILREFRRYGHAGVLIHGLGHQGKSSLAARIANRMNQHKPVVVFGNYDAEAILAAIRTGFQTAEFADTVERCLPRIRKDPAYLTIAIREILETTCRENPMLLIFDDLERILEDPRNQELHRVRSDLTDVMRAVIQAFDRAETLSRLIITSRFAFTLPSAQGNDLAEKLLNLPLPAMEPYENEKQAILKAKYGNIGKSVSEPVRTRRCIRASRGNPGLCDLLFSLSLENPEVCDQALGEMEAYIKGGQAPSQQKLSDFLENLAITHLLNLLSAPEKKLLQDSAMFMIPAPLKTLRLLADAVRAGNMAEQRLIGLGLWEVYEDIFNPKEPAAAVNALVKPLFREREDAEKETIAKIVVRDLFERWGGNDGRKRPFIADIELARLAVAGKDTTVAAAAGEDALRGLENQFEYRKAAQLAIEMIGLLDEEGVDVPPSLLRTACERCDQIGDVENARRFIRRSVEALKSAENSDEQAYSLSTYALLLEKSGEIDSALELHNKALSTYQQLGDRRSVALMMERIARIWVNKGEIDKALRFHLDALDVYTEINDLREKAVTMGSIARILVSKGEVEEALKLHQEMLSVFEELGDRRSRAVTLGDIARILVSKGEVEEALKLQNQRLETNKELGNLDGIGAALFDIAQIELQQQSFQEAYNHLSESYAIFNQIGRLDFLCYVGMYLGHLLCQAEQKKDGIRILKRSEEGFLRLGWDDQARQVEEIIRQVHSE